MSQPAESTRPYQHVLGMLKVGEHVCSGRALDVREDCHQQEPRPDGADRKEQALPVPRVPARPQHCWCKDRQPQQHNASQGRRKPTLRRELQCVGSGNPSGRPAAGRAARVSGAPAADLYGGPWAHRRGPTPVGARHGTRRRPAPAPVRPLPHRCGATSTRQCSPLIPQRRKAHWRERPVGGAWGGPVCVALPTQPQSIKRRRATEVSGAPSQRHFSYWSQRRLPSAQARAGLALPQSPSTSLSSLRAASASAKLLARSLADARYGLVWPVATCYMELF